MAAEKLTVMSFGTNKIPPKFENEGEYEVWKRDLDIWCKFTDLAEEKQALAIHLSLSGKARQISSQLTVAQLNAKNGVKTLLDKLDLVFLEDKGRRQFYLFRELYNLRRAHDVKVQDFVTEFEHAYYKFSTDGMKLPDSVISLMLLAACSLEEKEVQIVMSSMVDVTYDIMKATIKRVYGSSINTSLTNSNSEVKDEPAFQCNETAYFGKNWQRGRTDRRAWRGRGFRARGARSLASGSSSGGGRKLNPLDRDGNISRCNICDSKFHWAGRCPDAYENNNYAKYTVDEKQREDEQETAEVHLSLFIGYTNGKGEIKENKLNSLVSDAAGCALLDSGCSKTVCGEGWLQNYVSGLSLFDQTYVNEEVSSSTFTFGDGVSERSLKRVNMPCYIGGKRAMIETDVVRCNIPMLLSKNSMKKGNMLLNFGNDTLRVCDNVIKLNSSSSGHYLLPLQM